MIRPAKPSDLLRLNELQQKLIEFERQFDKKIKRSGAYYYLIEQILKSNDSKIFVAERSGKIIGCGLAQIRKDESNWTINETYGHIDLMFVEEGYRNQGFGRKIMIELINWLKSKGIDEIRLKSTLFHQCFTGGIMSVKNCGMTTVMPPV